MATVTRNQNLYDMAWVTEKYPSTHYTLNSSTWYSIHDNVWEQRFLFKVTEFPSSLKHNKLIGAQLRVYTDTNDDEFLSFEVGALTASYNAANVTYYKMPPIDYWISDAWNSTTGARDRYTPESLFGTNAEAKNAHDILNAPALYVFASEDCTIKTVLSGGGTPYVHITYSDSVKVTSKVQYKSGAKSGYCDPRIDNTFAWDYVKNGSNVWCAVESWEQTDATFYWKISTDETYTAVSAGTTKSVTIPANTFPANSTIQWYVSGTDEDSTTTQTSVFSFSTAAGTASSNCVDPVNQVIDGSADYTFNWTISSTDGQPASRTSLNWKKTTDNAWTTLVDEASQLTSYVVAGGTFPAGSIDWQVIPYNIDGVVGVSSQATFISVAAPAAVQGLAATAVPFSTISWQSSEQRAYKILVDGVEVVKAFGDSVYSYQLTEPLSDGDHEITVMVQGQYGYWSQPSSVIVTIENVPDEDITLTARFGVDVQLSWSTESGTNNFYVYRDGKQIAHTFNTGFVDRLALGTHRYYVINRLPNGNYSSSEEIIDSTCFEGARIALFSGGNWMNITLTEKSATEQSFSYSRKYSLRHVSGAVYPVLEVSSFEDFAGSYDCAFNSGDDALAFEKFKGKTVIIKTRGNKVIVGALVTMSSHYGDFLAGYSFSIQQIHFEDYVDDTNG